MLVHEGIRRFGRSELRKRQINQPHPSLSDRFMIGAACRAFRLMMLIVSFYAGAHAFDSLRKGMKPQVKIGCFDMLTVMPLFEGKNGGLELIEK